MFLDNPNTLKESISTALADVKLFRKDLLCPACGLIHFIHNHDITPNRETIDSLYEDLSYALRQIEDLEELIRKIARLASEEEGKEVP